MNLNMQGLKGIVTGGSRGIGRAVMENFLAEDMKLATCARGKAVSYTHLTLPTSDLV